MLVNTYSQRIFNMAYQFSGSYEESEDMTQEIFLKLYHSLRKYDSTKNFNAWLLTLSKNHLIDHYRKTKWEKKNRDEFDEHFLSSKEKWDPEEGMIKEESKKFLWEGLNRLPSEVRMAVILRDIQGKKYEEIAETLELPLGTVKSRVNRGRVQLAKMLRQKRRKSHEL